MSASRSAQAITFSAHADSALDWLVWIKASNRFEDVVKERILWDGMEGQQKRLVQEKLGLSLPEQRVIVNSLYVTVAAAFEECLRQLICKLADGFTSCEISGASVPEPLMRLNVRESARLLRRIDSPPDYLVVDFWELCRQLGACHPTSSSVSLNSVALSDLESLIKLESFMDRVGAFGVNVSFDSLAINPDVCNALGLTKREVRANAKVIREAAVEVARLRNRIAHMGVNASDVTEEILQRDISFLKALADAFDSEAMAAIAKISAQRTKKK